MAFMANLKNLKQATIWWAKEKKLVEDAKLGHIERWITESFSRDGDGFESKEKKHILLLKEKRRREILVDREALWRLRRRAILLASGDENTKKIHAYARGRKVQNTMWEMSDDRGVKASDFDGISSLGVNHFKKLFSNPPGTSIAEIVKIASLFPSFVDEEGN